jgi:hypothetical protein
VSDQTLPQICWVWVSVLNLLILCMDVFVDMGVSAEFVDPVRGRFCGHGCQC